MLKDLKEISKGLKNKEGKEIKESIYLDLFYIDSTNYNEKISLAIEKCDDYLEDHDEDDLGYLFYKEVEEYLLDIKDNVEIKNSIEMKDEYLAKWLIEFKDILGIDINIIGSNRVLDLVNSVMKHGYMVQDGRYVLYNEDGSVIKIKGLEDLSDL